MRDPILIAIVLGCTLMALRFPFYGILAYIGFGFFSLNSMAWGIARLFPFAQFIGLATLLGHFLSSEPKQLPRQREVFLMLALWGMFGCSSLLAIYPDIAFERFVHVSKILLMVVMAMILVNSEHRVHLLMRVIALSLGYYGLKFGLFAVATGGGVMVEGPEQSFIASNNAIGLALAINIPLLVYLLRVETSFWFLWLIRAMIVFSYPAVVCSYSRGAWLALATATFLLMLRSKYRGVLITGSFALGFFMLPILPQILPQRILDRFEDLRNYKEEGAAQSRLWNWEFCKRVGLANPVAGGGFNFSSRETYEQYYPEFLERFPGKEWSCHNTPLTVFSEHGFPGFFLWAGLFGSSWLSLRRLRASARANGNMSRLGHCADMLPIAFSVYLVGGSFYDAGYFDLFYYLVAVVVTLKEVGQRAALAELPTIPLINNGRIRSPYMREEAGLLR
jgi:probable O-glycosylation ligase (exosortase A-associated)